jgi:SAM-dependent methyltransferase
MAPAGEAVVTAFDRIYRHNLWNGQGSRSGPGSDPVATSHPRRSLLALMALIDPVSVLDVGCGDGAWMPDLPGYVGLDVSSVAIEAHAIRHPARTLLLDRGEPYPRCDVVLTRDAMQHLSLDDGVALLTRALDTRPAWLIASTYTDGANVDIPTGLDAAGAITFYRPDLSAPPFGLGRPLLLIPDGYSYHDPDAIRDPGKFLGVWRP